MMRKPIFLLFVIAAALLGEAQVSNAQSPYSYPWCAILPGAGSASGGAMSQCPATTRVGSSAGQQCSASAATASRAHIKGSPRIGKASIARASPSCVSPQFDSCCENFCNPS